MKYFSIDLETTGLDPKTCQIIEFGAVMEDTMVLKPVENLESCHYYIEHEYLVGSSFALNMNAGILKILAVRGMNFPIIYPGALGTNFHRWLQNFSLPVDNRGKLLLTAAGKNFAGFGRRFLENPEYCFFKDISILHRTIDPAIYFTKEEDKGIPDTKTCLARAGLGGEPSHTAVGDARDVIRLMRAATNNYQSWK